MAANPGFEVIVLADGTTTFDRAGPDGRVWAAQDLHEAELAILPGEFARFAPRTTCSADETTVARPPCGGRPSRQASA